MTLVFGISGVPMVLPFWRTLESLGLGEVRHLEAEVKGRDASWPVGVSHLYLEGRSICPVEVRSWSTGQFQVFIAPGSSADDCELGARLLAAVGRFAEEAISPKGQQPLDADAFVRRYDRAWALVHAREALATLIAASAELGAPQVVNGIERPFAIGPRMRASLECEQDPVAALMRRFLRFNQLAREDVYEGQLLVISEGGRKPARAVRVAAYGGVATLLSGRADFVCMLDGSRLLHLRLESLAELLGDSGVWLSEDALLASAVPGHAELSRDGTVLTPVVPDGRWAELVRSARAHDVEDIFAGAAPPSRPGPREKMLPAEWAQLTRAPFMVFALVAGEQGARRQASQRALHDALLLACQGDCPVVRLVATDVLLCFESTLAEELACDSAERARRIARVTNLAETRLSAGQAAAFKLALLSVAARVPVERSGVFGRMFGAGHDVTDARNAVATLLRARGLA